MSDSYEATGRFGVPGGAAAGGPYGAGSPAGHGTGGFGPAPEPYGSVQPPYQAGPPQQPHVPPQPHVPQQTPVPQPQQPLHQQQQVPQQHQVPTTTAPPSESPQPQGARHALVRPYAMTGGRTRPRYQLAIEALVSTTERALQAPGLLPEHQRITALCGQVKSVAEISALLSIPLGVARILVADLAEAGLVAIHQPGSTEAGQPDVTLLERVLSGLRKL